MSEPRIIASFSCGAASAVATKLALEDFGPDRVTIINIEIQEEHPDNRRYLADCEQWFGSPIEVLRDTKYNSSIIELFLKRSINVGPGRTRVHLRRARACRPLYRRQQRAAQPFPPNPPQADTCRLPRACSTSRDRTARHVSSRVQ